MSGYQSIVLAAPKSAKLPGAMKTQAATSPVAADSATTTEGEANKTALSNEGSTPTPTNTQSKAGSKHDEIVSKRTENSESFDIGGGQVEVRQYLNRVHYKVDGQWQKIDTSLVKDSNAAESTNPIGKAIAWIKGKTQDINTYKVKANDWQAKFAASDDKVGMVRIEADGKKISFTPQGATAGITPTVTTNSDGIETIRYINLWPDTDVIYTVKNDMLKEEIAVKSTKAPSTFRFAIDGADLKKNKDGGFDVQGVKQSFSELSVTRMLAGPTSENVISQDYSNGILTMSLDAAWVKKQAANEFPIVIDPTWGRRTGNVSWNYSSYKSDGYGCSSSVCFMNAGELYDNGWKNWRTPFYVNYNELQGKQLLAASMYLQQANRSYLVGYGGDRYYIIGHATCIGYNCIDSSVPQKVGLINYAQWVDMTDLLQAQINRGDWGSWWILWGEEYQNYTYKGFDPDLSYMSFHYNSRPSKPVMVTPSEGQTFVDPQVSFQVNPSTDPDDAQASLKYNFTISDANGGGIVVSSGEQSATQWTVPDGVLQDGTQYAVNVYATDGYGASDVATTKFKVDMRRGKDKTQSADTIGPVSVDLATGNVSTSISSHDTTALGGNLGVSLDYNSPLRTRNGLVGKYWDMSQQNQFPDTNSTPTLTRVDKSIDFDWKQASYSAGRNTDWVYAQWSGYFVAPVSGTYQFGAINDDWMNITVKGTTRFANSCMKSTPCFDSYAGSGLTNSVYLDAGEVAPIFISYQECTGDAYAKLYVRGPVAEQIVPTEWLQTEPRQLIQNKGLQGRYYYLPANGATPNLDATDKTLFLSRTEPTLSFNWGTGSPVAGGPTDFMSRWEGYISVPVTGDYKFSTWSDDGMRLKIDGKDPIINTWGSCCSEVYATETTHLEAGKYYSIVVDHYDSGGPGQFYLYATGQGSTNFAHQIVPTSWLSPRKQVLPNGWQLGIDPDGDLSYDRINSTASSATLTDSSGDTHMYTWTGSAYKPPVNEDGQLTRNADGTFTLIDVDGKTYNFKQDGELGLVTLPTDDRKPAALAYSYDGGRISKIADGVDVGRYAQVYYYGDKKADGSDACSNATSSDFLPMTDARITGYICAVTTNDGRTTSFFYTVKNADGSNAVNPMLGRVSKPGNEATDYQYDAVGRIVSVRDSVANDAIAASLVTKRYDDDTTKTQISYDALGRAIAVKAPAATAGGTRQEQTIGYKQYAMPLVRYRNPSNGDERFVTTGGVPTPAGYIVEPHISASLLMQQLPGTHPLYSCRLGTWDQFVSQQANCEGQNVIGFIGYAYDAAQQNDLTVPIYRCLIGGDHFVSSASNCEGFPDAGLMGYAIKGNTVYGQTTQKITGDTPPSGFARKIEWDSTFRTVQDTDATGNQTYQQWDSVKDLLRSTTDATGLKSTTIYDANDMPTDSYGPAPSAWFDATGIPASNADKIPHTKTVYDGDINGPAVAWFNYKSSTKTLTGAPKLHTTGIESSSAPANGVSSFIRHDFRTVALPFTPDYSATTGVDGYGFTATGKLTFPASATYTFKSWTDDGARLYIDDTQIFSNWGTITEGAQQNTLTGTFVAEAGKAYRFKLDYGHVGTAMGAIDVWLSGAGIADQSGQGLGASNWGTMLKPDYGLQTSQTVYGAPTANGQTANLTSTTYYGTNPELGLAQSATTDSGDQATHLNLTATSTYEVAGASGSYLRQKSSSLPAGATTKYDYYGAVTDVDNPCTTDVTEHYREGGMLRLKTEPDPDGTGPQTPRTTETIYDDAGKVVATRYNQDAWTCTIYDERERVATTKVPAFGTQPERIITNDYKVNANPLITSSTDTSGSSLSAITVETDLLGRNVKYTDARGNVTTSEYDTAGHLVKRTSPLGVEQFVYDNADRLTDQKLDGLVLAHVTYDTYSRISSIQYQSGLSLNLTRESTTSGLGRLIGRTYTTSTGQTLSDTITRAVTGDVTSGTELGQAKAYSYDTAGRLVSASVAGNTFTYGYGTQDASCTALPGANANAGKDSNRTSQTVNGVTTTYCYNQADQLIGSSNPLYDTPVYDTHGNTTSLGSAADSNQTKTLFTYDSSDRNIGITETNATGSITTTYARDVQGRLLYRHQDTNGSTVSNDYYGYTASGDFPDFITDISGAVIQKYLTLPGGTLVTIRPIRQSAGVRTVSLTNIHGDVMATIDADGQLPGNTAVGPFGEQIQNQADSWNALTGTTYGYTGQSQKQTETKNLIRAIQMGARVYLPGIGRFLSVDPIEGGTPNTYVYPTDPVNEFDLDGMSQKGIQSKQPKRLSQAEQRALEKKRLGQKLTPQEKKQLKSAEKKQNVTNKKLEGERRNRNNKGGKPPAAPSGGIPVPPIYTIKPPSPQQIDNVKKVGAAVAAGAVVVFTVWWTAKAASPACGPAVLVCAVVL